jgi:GntR family transcriptional repressor for pyruvate dehydrogenase complex
VAVFDKVRRVRSFDDVVDQLREAIYAGRIRPGERLPGERQLCEAFGVGRPTLREALRSLEAVGLIEVRPGKGGGSYAVTPSASTVGDALAALVGLRGASLEDLAEFRVDFESENAAWAARRATADDIGELEAIVTAAEAVLRRHRAATHRVDAHIRAIPEEIAAVTRAVASGEPERARQAMRTHIETWNQRGVAS